MSDKSIIIIGAGLAGLATGIHAQRNGYRTHIFEHHTLPGGVCTAWERGGYTIDGCIHWLMWSRPGSLAYRIYDEVGALQGNRLIPLDHFERAIVESTETILDYTADLDRLERDMKAISPGDGPVIEEIVAGSRALQGYDMSSGKPAELMGPVDTIKQMWDMRRVLRYAVRYNTSVGEFAGRIQDPSLRWAVTNFFLPEMPVVFMFVVLGQLAAGQLALVEGGSMNFARAVAQRYQDLGGEISYGATVEEILVNDNRAAGVRLADGSAHRADIVVSAADGYSTIFKMLGGRFVDEKTRDRYENWPLFRPLILASYGVARRFAGQPAENLVSLQRPILVGPQKLDGLMFRIFHDPTMAPPGKTVVQVTLETDFDYWWKLHDDLAHYEAEKERIAAEVLDRLESHLPGISTSVEMTDVATPYTLWRYTRNHRAAFEGWQMTPKTMTVRIPKTLPGLENFYMAGQWVEPGGGIPMVLLSGRQVAQIICHRDDKRL